MCAVYTACSSQKLWAKIESLRERHDSSEMFLSWQYRVSLGTKTTTPSCVPVYTARSSQNVLAERKSLRERHQRVLQRWQIQGAGGCKDHHTVMCACVHCTQQLLQPECFGGKEGPEREASNGASEVANTGCRWVQKRPHHRECLCTRVHCMQPETESHRVGRKREPERQARRVVVELTNTGCHLAQTLVCGGDLHTPSRVPVCTARSN